MQCTKCHTQFDYASSEKKAYERFNNPLPDICPDCRHLRHLVFRNEKNLYYNKSAKSSRTIIALYPSSSPFKIVDQDEWWSDDFDTTVYGRDFDFNKPFFEQYKDLQRVVPRWARIVVNSVNSDFCNNCANVKDCYLTFSSYESQNLYYCMRVFRCSDCIDCLNISDSQYCSMSAHCKRCYNVHYSFLCNGCSDSYFIFDCKASRNCIMTAQVRSKEYMIRGKEYSKEQYEIGKEKFLREFAENPDAIKEEFKEMLKDSYHKHLNMINSENCMGNFINDSKNIINGFFVIDSEDCMNIYDSSALKDCYDNSYNEKSELCVEIDTSYNLYNSKFCTYTITLRDCMYCDQCDHLIDCFGCIGLKRQKNRILNKQYSAEEYKNMLVKIKAHMQKTGEFGKPFPSTLSPFPYNITMGQDVAPLSKKEALDSGYMWYEEEKDAAHFGKNTEIPRDIRKVDDSICDKILVCEKTGKNYKIIPQELKFYKKLGIPVPRISSNQRYYEMSQMQPPKKLTDTTCYICGEAIKTVYPKESGYKVVCEKCYLEKVY